ncbi:hypothetical protein SEPL_395 [Salmonella phage SE_PL]|nr:hypothetical protein CPT_Munch_026 [Salmonella phage Munch]QCW18697.1 hypothetical protein 7t3_0176 [Salmonella phage 7t3]QIG63008.1 hypothetical protein SEPL_395 [Salmonella phage SE_PL]WNV47133.1 hypothetical protein [Klebsiella phage fENko-Kae01]WNV47648.1 hypothetical protein [Klebsiella phage fENko-Kae01]
MAAKTFEQLKWVAGQITDDLMYSRMNEAVLKTVFNRRTKSTEMATLCGLVCASAMERKINTEVIERYLRNVHTE